MAIRDEEIKRLIQYAKGLNLKVSFTDYVPYSRDAGYWSTDGSELIICLGKRDSKIEIVLTLIHELGHHLEWVHNHHRKPHVELNAAFDDEEKKTNRKIIYQYEVNSSNWWDIIYKETDMKFPIKRLHIQKEYDIWQYEVYYETSKFPTKKESKDKLKQLRRKYD